MLGRGEERTDDPAVGVGSGDSDRVAAREGEPASGVELLGVPKRDAKGLIRRGASFAGDFSVIPTGTALPSAGNGSGADSDEMV